MIKDEIFEMMEVVQKGPKSTCSGSNFRFCHFTSFNLIESDAENCFVVCSLIAPRHVYLIMYVLLELMVKVIYCSLHSYLIPQLKPLLALSEPKTNSKPSLSFLCL